MPSPDDDLIFSGLQVLLPSPQTALDTRSTDDKLCNANSAGSKNNGNKKDVSF